MRALAYLLIIWGAFLVSRAAYDQHRGVADTWAPAGRPRAHLVIARKDDPKQFRNLMQYEWLYASLSLLSGFILLGFCQRADRLDPFSPGLAGSDAWDDLNRTLTEEEKKRNRPLK